MPRTLLHDIHMNPLYICWHDTNVLLHMERLWNSLYYLWSFHTYRHVILCIVHKHCCILSSLWYIRTWALITNIGNMKKALCCHSTNWPFIILVAVWKLYVMTCYFIPIQYECIIFFMLYSMHDKDCLTTKCVSILHDHG